MKTVSENALFSNALFLVWINETGASVPSRASNIFSCSHPCLDDRQKRIKKYVLSSENETKMLVLSKIFCFVFYGMKTNTFKNTV